MRVENAQALPVVRIGDVDRQENAQRWLIDQLWGAASVGVIGGAPKCSKTWLGLDMALSVATGTPCLGAYAVPESGPVLVYLAEDALKSVRVRVEGMARHRGLNLHAVPMHVITAPALRLDLDRRRDQLYETARRLRPRLLLLDPLVRLHRADENHATEMAELLAYFRFLQRELDLALILVHHTRKNGAGASGQTLRGSSDIHAFGDSNLYLRRTQRRLVLSCEHRAAPASPPIYLELATTDAETIRLEAIPQTNDDHTPNLERRTLELFVDQSTLTRAKLRAALAIKNQRLGETLETLEKAGEIRRTPTGWQRVAR